MSVRRSDSDVHEHRHEDYNSLMSQWRYDHYSVAAADLTTGTGQAGNQVLKEADLVSWGIAGGMRSGVEVAEILEVESWLIAWCNSTQSEDGTVQVLAEVSKDGDSRFAERLEPNVQTDSINGSNIDRIDGTGTFDADSWNVMEAVAHAPFSENANGVGGAGTSDREYQKVDFTKYGGGPIVDADDDDIFNHLAFRTWNIDDGAIHASIRTRIVADIDVAEPGERLHKHRRRGSGHH